MQFFLKRKTKAHFQRTLLTTAAMTLCGALMAAPPPGPPILYPDILVTGLNTYIPDGDTQPLKMDGTYFGVAQIGVNTWEHSFEIRNTGRRDLLVEGLALGDQTIPALGRGGALSPRIPESPDFEITQRPANLVPPGQSTWFSIRYTPSATPQSYTTVHITSNDPDEGDYDFVIRGDSSETPLVGPDLHADLTFYKKYKCKGIPLLACKMGGRVFVQNLSTDYDLSRATVRVYVTKGDVLNGDRFLLAQKSIKKLKAFKPGKKNKPKKVKFKGYVPPGYSHIYAEVVPEDGSEDINYTNNRTAYVYGLF